MEKGITTQEIEGIILDRIDELEKQGDRVRVKELSLLLKAIGTGEGYDSV